MVELVVKGLKNFLGEKLMFPGEVISPESHRENWSVSYVTASFSSVSPVITTTPGT